MSLGLITAASFANTTGARAFFWDDDPYFVEQDLQPAPVARPKQQQQPARPTYPKLPEPPKNLAKPEGPLTVAISLQHQSLKVYASNGLYSESAISSGNKTHPTPTGIFSIIQKSKWHRSNLYSDAPMPYMQRLTWSGIAVHAGSLPGYPASHGCIRVPMSFASKMWVWSRMGARVIVTQGEVAPVAISHRLLPSERPQPELSPQVKSQSPVRSTILLNKTTEDAGPELKLNLRPAISDSATTTQSMTQLADAATSVHLSPVISDATATLLHGSVPHALDLSEADKDAAAVDTSGADGNLTTASTTDAAPAAEPVPATEPASTKPGRIAVLISGKDARLYVRRNFEPMFDIAIDITDPMRPLGTHVFTAATLKDRPDAFHWTVVSIPDQQEPVRVTPRGRKAATPAISTPASTASAIQTLDRLNIPDDAMRQIGEMLMSGGSIIVTDQAMKASRETGKGTDFIVPL